MTFQAIMLARQGMLTHFSCLDACRAYSVALLILLKIDALPLLPKYTMTLYTYDLDLYNVPGAGGLLNTTMFQLLEM
jgi:hypothetical protein